MSLLVALPRETRDETSGARGLFPCLVLHGTAALGIAFWVRSAGKAANPSNIAPSRVAMTADTSPVSSLLAVSAALRHPSVYTLDICSNLMYASAAAKQCRDLGVDLFQEHIISFVSFAHAGLVESPASVASSTDRPTDEDTHLARDQKGAKISLSSIRLVSTFTVRSRPLVSAFFLLFPFDSLPRMMLAAGSRQPAVFYFLPRGTPRPLITCFLLPAESS